LQELEGKQILMTGASGFIGSHLLDYFISLNQNILTNPCKITCIINKENVVKDKNVTTIKADLTQGLLNKLPNHNFDYVIHLAAVSSPQQYKKNPLRALDLSYIGTRNILDFSKECNAKSVLCFSSAAIYGNPNEYNTSLNESNLGTLSPFSDRSSYTIGKKVLETLCYTYFKKFNLPVKIVRPFNIYGPRMDKNSVLSRFIFKIINGEEIHLYGDGEQTRTFCHISDAIDGFIKVMLDGQEGEAYNIGDEHAEKSMIEVVKLLFKVSERKTIVKTVNYPSDYPKDEPRRSVPDMTKMKKMGFINKVFFEKGLSDLFYYYVKQMERNDV